jgi:hypothetical protein
MKDFVFATPIALALHATLDSRWSPVSVADGGALASLGTPTPKYSHVAASTLNMSHQAPSQSS